MRVTLVGGPGGGDIGGGERVVRSQATYLAERGHSVSLVTPSDPRHSRVDIPQVPHLTSENKLGKFQKIIGLTALVRKTRPDVVLAHVGMEDLGAIVAGRVARRLAIYSHGGPFVPLKYDVKSESLRKLRKLVIHRLAYGVADLVITNSKWCALAFRHVGIDAEVVYPGVDSNFFRPFDKSVAREQVIGHLRRRDGVRDDVPVFLNVGWFRANKRHDLLLDALRLIVTAYPSTLVVFIGRGNVPKMMRYTQSKGLIDNTLFLTDVDDRQLRLWYCASDAYVHMNGLEHFGLPIAEAHSCGTPSIVPNRGGGREIVEDGRTGFLFDDGHVASLAEKMIYCIEHRGQVSTMREACRARILNEFDHKVVNEKLENLLNRVVMPERVVL